MPKSGESGDRALERREFLKLGAAGVAATLGGCVAVGDGRPDGSGQPVGEGGNSGAAMVPEPGDLVDPADIRAESWHEPWVWRPDRWPGAQLDLNVVRTQNPGFATSAGNPTPSLFSFNGQSPGPTVRVRGDGELRIRVRNTLGLNERQTPVGPCPDMVDVTPELARATCMLAAEQLGDDSIEEDCLQFIYPEQFLQVIRGETRPGWALRQHTNGLHCAHTTNLHTHGLHVFPQTNPDGSCSDDVGLRIIPQPDWEARLASDDESLHELAPKEHVGFLDYRYLLAYERGGGMLPHPPGTHWYHPHAHGSTHDQVSSGMAGFLIVEGDVDDAINEAMTGTARPDPETSAGPWDYRERLMFIQRVVVQPLDLDAGPKRNTLRFPPLTAVNGIPEAGCFRMRPGAVERWRVLNGSVDGAGTKRFMVLDGQFVQRDNRIWRVVTEGEGEERTRRLEAVTEQDIEDAKLDLHQLAFDGITLVSEVNGKAVHRIRDLSAVNAGTVNPFAADARPGESWYSARLRALESVYRDGDSLRRAYARPNEVYLTNANRTDLLFKAPIDSAGRVFTVFAKEAHIQTDNHQRFLQVRIENPEAGARRELFDVVVGYIHVAGDAVAGGDFDIRSLNDKLPPVPPLLQPVRSDELMVPRDEARATGVSAGSKRCRVLSYSGIGSADFPRIEVPEAFAAENPELENRTWAWHDGVRVLLPAITQTMGIHTEFDLAADPDPGPPHKFSPHDDRCSRVLVDTAEEWVLYNSSMMLWSNTDLERFPQPGSWADLHFIGYPLSRAEGQRRFHAEPQFRLSSKGNDHPFHIHINPMWVIRIDVPDEDGELHNVLPEPMWMDTVAIPRNGGRVVFRTRFDDFTGEWVNHCHVLNHEDNGMMQQVRCSDDPAMANYRVRESTSEHGMTGREVDAIYPKPSRELMYRQNLSFVELNEIGPFEYPGFELEIPELDT